MGNPKTGAFKASSGLITRLLGAWHVWTALTPEQQALALKELRAFAAGKPSALDKLPKRDGDDE